MRLALELLPEEVDPNLVERFERNLESMDELISDATRFAKGAGEAVQEIELLNFVKEVVASFDPAVKLMAGVDESIRVKIPPSAFRRVLINLVNNGIKYGNKVSIQLEADSMRVLDDGPGIPYEYRAQVFQPFFRLDGSRSASGGGSGLGLAIVHQLCLVHGWTITIEDANPETKMKGAVFYLNFS